MCFGRQQTARKTGGSARQPPPVGSAPIVQHRGIAERIAVAIVDIALRFFHVVTHGIEQTPTGFARFDIQWRAPGSLVAPFSGAERGIIVLRVFERNMIGAAGQAREPKLREVVLPQADGAFLVVTGLADKHQVTAAGAGKFSIVQHDYKIGRSPADCKLRTPLRTSCDAYGCANAARDQGWSYRLL